jgi:hypothetical protein
MYCTMQSISVHKIQENKSEKITEKDRVPMVP